MNKELKTEFLHEMEEWDYHPFKPFLFNEKEWEHLKELLREDLHMNP